MKPIRNTARMAGSLYLLSAVAAGVPVLYVSNALIVPGDAAATSQKILAFESLFRASIVSELVGAVLFLFVVRALYQLFDGVDKPRASLMVTLVLASVPITFLNVLNEIAALTLLHGGGFLAVFDKAQRDGLAMLFLGLHGDGVNVVNIFWGLWLFPFGSLIMKSGLLPRWLGVLLLVNGAALVFVSLTALLLPADLDLVSRLAILPELGELWTIAWLLIKGARVPAAKTI